jgi:predicted Zn finger-like uncharacterized protein
MLIDCPGCAKSYRISRATLGPNGKNVACPHCLTSWFATVDAAAIEADDTSREEVSNASEITAEAVSGRSRETSYEELYGSPAAIALPSKPVRKPGLPRAALAICASIGLAVGLIGFRTTIVKLWPQANKIYGAAGFPVNQRGLGLQNVRVNLIRDGAQEVLVVEGEVANLRNNKAAVPRLRMAVRDPQGHEIYTWDAASPKTKLEGLETISFRARLAAPPAEGHDVFVRFAAAEPNT